MAGAVPGRDGPQDATHTWAPLTLHGLLGPGERKSLRPVAARLGLSGHDQLQHFIASPAWDDGPLWSALVREADRLVGGPDARLMIDDTALPQKGTRSVGVARQSCGSLGNPSKNSGGQLPVAGLAQPGEERGAGRLATMANLINPAASASSLVSSR